MQPATQLSNEQKYSMSWLQFISSVLFAFFGTGLITVFLAMPLTIYTAGLTNKKTNCPVRIYCQYRKYRITTSRTVILHF